jgi:2,3-bisphosphoglycerate-independent phosphoglycerate mutase
MPLELERHPLIEPVDGPVVVCVMDGVGIGRHDESDSVWLARTPVLDRLGATALTTRLLAHGKAIGMPSDQDMGNSEAGHNALGAGRVFDQGTKLVDHAIGSGEIFREESWRSLTTRVRESGESFHFIGLLSDGNVHSHIDQLLALLRRCDAEDVASVRIHVLLDGRDVPQTSALEYIDALEVLLREIDAKPGRDYRIASGGGRMRITMDRYEADWKMVEEGWNAHVHGHARPFESTREAILTLRDEAPGISDQILPPFVIVEGGEPVGRIRDGASVVFFNFRGDRALEITQAFEYDDFAHFERGQRPDVLYAGMLQYDGDMLLPTHFLVQPPAIDRTLGEYLVHAGMPQLAISETQKYGHVTYFWNGNRTGQFDDRLETYVEIPGGDSAFEEHPEMKAVEITDRVVAAIESNDFRHIRLNYPNGDMVGHTGVRDAATRAIEVVDSQIGRLLPVIEKLGGALIVTADHGNADEMYLFDAKTGEPKRDSEGRPLPKTSHSLNPVPLHIYAPKHEIVLAAETATPSLANVAATVMNLLGFRAPDDYEKTLIAPPAR